MNFFRSNYKAKATNWFKNKANFSPIGKGRLNTK